MEIITGLLIIAGIYLWLLFMDMFFRVSTNKCFSLYKIKFQSCSHYAYLQFLKGTGLEIRFLQIRWTTTALNKLLLTWGSKYIKFLNVWFNLGTCIAIFSLPICIYLLFTAFYQNIRSNSNTDEIILEPVLPGVNLPLSELGYYSLTLLISSLVHELGHALAAAQEDIALNNVGANIILVLPIAFVNLNSDKLFSLQPWKRLKILCAGVWHNLFIALLAYLLYNCLPILFSGFYQYGNGVLLVKIHEKSPLLGTNGLNSGDLITNINSCKISDENSYLKCLQDLQTHKPGFCIKGSLIHDLDESIHLKPVDDGVVNCCSTTNSGKLCFEYLDPKDGILELPPYVCLPGKIVILQSEYFCTDSPHVCPKETFCFQPVLANHTNLFKIKRFGKGDVIYLGIVSDFIKTIKVSSYVPQFSWISSDFPDILTKMCGYLVVFSIGLAIVNLLPCLLMDGQYITDTLFEICLFKHLRKNRIKLVSGFVTVFFTVLLLVHCVSVIWNRVF